MKYIIFLSLLVIFTLLFWIGKDLNQDPVKKVKKSKKDLLDKQGEIFCTEVEQSPIDLKSLDDSLSRYFNNLDTNDSGNGDNEINIDLIVKSKLLLSDDQQFEVIFKIDKYLLHKAKPIYLVSYYPQGNTISVYNEMGNEIGTQREAENDSGEFDYKKNSVYVETLYDVTNQTNEDRIIKTILKQNKSPKEIIKYEYDQGYYYFVIYSEIHTSPEIYDSNGQFISQYPSNELPNDWDQNSRPVKKVFHFIT